MCQPTLFTFTVLLHPNPKTFLKHRESLDEYCQNCTLQHPALHFLLTSLWILRKLLTQFGILPSFLNSSFLGFPLCFVKWIRSYLSIAVRRICNSYSRPFRLRRGVFQGSVLGPILFFPFINDLPTFLPTSVKTSIYADDLAIWASSPSVECATFLVQAALNRLVDWSSKWRLPLNFLKCELSFISLDPYQSRIQPSLHTLNTYLNPLEFNPHPTFLGVTFDCTLSFKYHVLSLQKKFHSFQPYCLCFTAFSHIPSFQPYFLCLLGPIKGILVYLI